MYVYIYIYIYMYILFFLSLLQTLDSYKKTNTTDIYNIKIQNQVQ